MSEIAILRVIVAFFGFVELLVAIVIAIALIFHGTSPSIRVENRGSAPVSVRLDGDLTAEVESNHALKRSLSGHGRIRSLAVTRASVPETWLTLDFPKSVSADRISVTVSDASALPVVPTPNTTPVSPPSRP